MSVYLTFDTATPACSAAIAVNGQVHHRFEIAPRRHTDLLLPMITELLQATNLTLNQIDLIGFGCGPGSFMGLRLATSVAQGLAYGIGCDVVPVSSLRALAQQAYIEHGVTRVVAGWDARIDEIYWGVFALDEAGCMQPLEAEQLSAPASIDFDTTGYALVGNAWQVYESQLPPALVTQSTSKLDHCYPTATAIQAIIAFQSERKSVSPLVAQPVYLRHNVAHRN